MAQVRASIVVSVAERARAAGHDRAGLLRDLSLEPDSSGTFESRVTWDEFARFLERVAAAAGLDFLEEAGADLVRNPLLEIFGVLVAGLTPQKHVYQLGARWYGPALFRNVQVSTQELAGGQLRQTLTLPASSRDSVEFFRFMLGALRAMPRLVGLPDALVQMEVHPRRAVYDIAPGAGTSLPKRRPFSVSEASATVLDEILRRESLLQSGEAFMRGLAHDLKNTLQVIRHYAELASRDLRPASSAAADLREISAATQRAAALVERLYARGAGSRRVGAIDLNAVLRRMRRVVVNMLGADVELTLELESGSMPVGIDRSAIEQLVVNLISNARDALSPGGSVRVETAVEQVGSGRTVRLSVRDDGHGMDEFTRDRAFDPSFTTKPAGRGSGIGLATVSKIIALAGGKVEIDSAPGSGTTLTVRLPWAEGPLAPDEEHPEAWSAASGKETLLLVENDEQTRTATRRTLEAFGYRVLEASSADRALELSRSHSESIAALVSDVRIGESDGRELAALIRRLRPEMRGVIFTSGYAPGELAGWGGLPAEYAFLTKPYEVRALLEALRRLLSRST